MVCTGLSVLSGALGCVLAVVAWQRAGLPYNEAGHYFDGLVPALLQEHQPRLVIVSIGGNDFLRQMSAGAAKATIREISRTAQAGGAQVLLVAVPQVSLLAAGTGSLKDHPLYAELAEELKLPLHAEGWARVLSQPDLRADTVHANAQGYRSFAEGLVQTLRKVGWLA